MYTICHNYSVCGQCVYLSPQDGIVRCAECSPNLCAPPFFRAINYLLDITSDPLDAFSMSGPTYIWRRSPIYGRCAHSCVVFVPARKVLRAWKRVIESVWCTSDIWQSVGSRRINELPYLPKTNKKVWHQNRIPQVKSSFMLRGYGLKVKKKCL